MNRQPQTLYILRGLPGSGKSSLAEEIRRRNGTDIPILNLDNFFTAPDGTYQFQPERVTEGIESLERQLVTLLAGGQSVIMDNTYSRLREYEHHLEAARRYRCRIVIRQILCPDEATARIFFERCKHGISWERFEIMRRRWEHDPRAILLTPFI